MIRTLRDISVILFDEFHERNLLSDVALAWPSGFRKPAGPI